MAIMDKKLELADDQAMTAANTQLALTNVIDLGNLSNAKDYAIGPGTPLYLNIRINRAVTGHPTTWDTSCSFKVQQGDSTVASGSFTGQEFNNPIELLTAGKWIARCPLDYNVNTKRYLRLLFSKNGSTAKALTTGSVDAWISPAVPETNVGT
jgi:hypothetical protein